MRVDSCRKCGNDLEVKQKCSICNKPKIFQCDSCHFETDEQIHTGCKTIEKIFKLSSIGMA